LLPKSTSGSIEAGHPWTAALSTNPEIAVMAEELSKGGIGSALRSNNGVI
jgi:hypothetical protein